MREVIKKLSQVDSRQAKAWMLADEIKVTLAKSNKLCFFIQSTSCDELCSIFFHLGKTLLARKTMIKELNLVFCTFGACACRVIENHPTSF